MTDGGPFGRFSDREPSGSLSQAHSNDERGHDGTANSKAASISPQPASRIEEETAERRGGQNQPSQRVR